MWLTLSFQLFALQMLLLNVCTFFEDYIPLVILRSVRFGRSGVDIHSDSTPLLFDVPKRWFTHFYIFATSFVTWTIYAYFNNSEFLKEMLSLVLGSSVCLPNATALLALCMLATQIFRRLYECLFISNFSVTAKMNITIYIVGFWHYFGAVGSVFGGSRGCVDLDLFYAAPSLLLFAFAWIKQLEAHKILASLRTNPADKSYRIPKGGLFDSVSCANYFAELLIYLSLSLVFGFQNYEMNWIAIWVLANQTYSAAMSHQWYLKKFGSEYPLNRKRIIPYIF